jgi:hypothetical protein
VKRVFWFALAYCCLSRSAQGAPLAAVIDVERSPEASQCPDGTALTKQVERILQRPLSGGAPADTLQVEVRFSATHDEYSAEVRSLAPKPGERRLNDRGQSCAAWGEAVSVAIALLLDTELARRETELSPPTASASALPASPQAPAEPAVHAVDEGALELRAAFEGGAATGLVGPSSALLSEYLGLRLQHHLTLDAGFNAVLPSTAQFDVGAVRTTLLFASLRACYTWGQRYAIGPCAAR